MLSSRFSHPTHAPRVQSYHMHHRPLTLPTTMDLRRLELREDLREVVSRGLGCCTPCLPPASVLVSLLMRRPSLCYPPFQHPPRAYHTTPLFTHRPPLTEHTQHSKREKRQRTSAPPRLATFLLQSRCLTDEVVPSVPTKSRRL